MEANTAAAMEGEVDGYGLSASEGQSPAQTPLMEGDVGLDMSNERSSLLPGKTGDNEYVVERDAAFIEREFAGYPWWKRPSVRIPVDSEQQEDKADIRV